MDPACLQDIPVGTTLAADIVLVGSGPAGATLARELAGSRASVILLESGGLQTDPGTDTLNEVDNVGEARTVDQSVIRSRILGGTSHLWSGRCIDLDDIDYQARPWVPHSGWPIGRAEMTPFLERSASHLGLGAGAGFSGDGFWTLARRRKPQPGLDPALVEPVFWQFSRTRNPTEYMHFGPVLRAMQAGNLRILTHATAVAIEAGPDGAVTGVHAAAPDGTRHRVAARSVVLCAGGIENARLLLASRQMRPAGLGNAHDQVGRYLMDHPRGGIATFDPSDAARLSTHFAMSFVKSAAGRHLFCQGLRLSPAAQEREGLLNCAVWLSELVAPDDPWSAVRRLARRGGQPARDAWLLVRHAGLVARGLRGLAAGTGLPRLLDGLELNCIVEQCPDPDSRITLSDRTDRHGVPVPRVDWRRHPLERRTLLRTAELVADALRAAGAPAPVAEAWLRDGAPFPTDFKDVAHHIGTTRMATDPRQGVVDADCQVHGVTRLYVAGSSVFPTSGHANPTQTIVALAIRLADRLR